MIESKAPVDAPYIPPPGTTLPSPEHTPTVTVTAPLSELDKDRQVLEELYVATDGRNWDWSHGPNPWLPDAPVCSWSGVECDNGRVVRLILNELNLHGTIPDSIGNLSALEIIDQNNLTGTIPSSITRLTRLQEIYLTNNPRLSGSIPDLPVSLLIVNLGTCNLTGTIPHSILNLTGLQYLVLAYNQLSGTIPSLPSAGFINLSYNQFEGTLPAFIPPEETRIIVLSLSHNRLNGTLENLANITLKELYLDDNNFTGAVEFDVGMRILDKLYISNNAFTSFNSSQSDPPEYLTACEASGNFFQCPIPDWLAQRCKATCVQ